MLFLEDFNDMTCGNLNCIEESEIFYLHSQCHPSSPTWSVFDKNNRYLQILCTECDKPIAEIAIASKERE